MRQFFAISFIIILVLTFVYFMILVYYIHQLSKKCGKGPLFERCEYSLILANISSFIETVFNLTSGFMLEDSGKINSNQLIPLIPAIYSTRLYAACMIFRIFRIYVLHKVRLGKLTELTLRKVSSWWFVLMITNVYSLITSVFFIVVIVIKHPDSYSLSLFNFSFYSIEAFLLMFFMIFAYKSNSHPTIILEYVFYSIFWTVGAFNYDKAFDFRWLYVIPLRNLILLLISAQAMHEHCLMIRPPLPLNVDLHHLVEYKELYQNFEKFVKKHNNSELNEGCFLYKELLKAFYTKNFENLNFLVKNSLILTNLLQESIFELRCEAIKEFLESFLKDLVQSYLSSKDYLQFRIEYEVSYN